MPTQGTFSSQQAIAEGEKAPLDVFVTKDGQGDLTIIVGEAGEAFRLVVWARVMRLASPVWSAMLDPSRGFAEATQKEVEFPYDDPEALLTVLRTAHLNFSALPEVLTSTQAFKLAILCDKYDTIALVKPFAELKRWKEDRASRNNQRFDVRTRLAWSYAIGDAVEFTKALHLLVTDVSIGKKGELLYMDTPFPEFPIEGLEEHVLLLRSNSLQASVTAIQDIFKTYMTDLHCENSWGNNSEVFQEVCTAAMLRCLIKGLAADDLQLWPLIPNLQKIDMSLGELQENVLEMRVRSPLAGHDACNLKIRAALGPQLAATGLEAMKVCGLPAHILNHLKDQAAK